MTCYINVLNTRNFNIMKQKIKSDFWNMKQFFVKFRMSAFILAGMRQ